MTCDAVVRLRAVAPVVAQRVAGQAGDDEVLHVDARIHDEAGAEDDAVDRPLDAVVGDDAVVTHFADALGHQFDVRPVEHRVPGVRDQDPLAAERVVGRECRDKSRIPDLAAQHFQCQRARHADQRGVQQPQQARFVGPVEPRSDAACAATGTSRSAASAAPNKCAGRAESPRRACAGTRAAATRAGAISRAILDGAAAGADRRDALAVQVVAVVPARRVEHLAARSDSSPGICGICGTCSGPVASTRCRAASRAPVRGRDVPAPVSLVEVRRVHRFAEADVARSPCLAVVSRM